MGEEEAGGKEGQGGDDDVEDDEETNTHGGEACDAERHDDVEREGEGEFEAGGDEAEGDAVGATFGDFSVEGEGGGGAPGEEKFGGVFGGFSATEVEEKDGDGFGDEDAGKEPREDSGGEEVGILEAKGDERIDGEENDGGENFLPEDEAKALVVGFFATKIG